jgi:glycerol-3-phosphate dehydrogenase
VALPGGDFSVDGFDDLIEDLRTQFAFLTPQWARRLARAYGTEAAEMLGDATKIEDLGQMFGADLSEAEVRWLMTREYAAEAADVIWRRSKLGLRMGAEEIAALEAFMAAE